MLPLVGNKLLVEIWETGIMYNMYYTEWSNTLIWRIFKAL